MKCKRIHGITGALTIAVFLATGFYMRSEFPELYGDREAVRFLYRANHVYILFSGLLNILAALVPPSSRGSALQTLGSLTLLFSAPLFVAAFVLEPSQASPMRPVTVTAAFLALIGTALFVLTRRENRRG